jgi:acyl carrier protein
MKLSQPNGLSHQVSALLAEALQVPLDQIPSDLAFGDLPQWDSMGHMEVMLRLEEVFGVEINNDTITNLVSLPAICQYLMEQGHSAHGN